MTSPNTKVQVPNVFWCKLVLKRFASLLRLFAFICVSVKVRQFEGLPCELFLRVLFNFHLKSAHARTTKMAVPRNKELLSTMKLELKLFENRGGDSFENKKSKQETNHTK